MPEASVLSLLVCSPPPPEVLLSPLGDLTVKQDWINAARQKTTTNTFDSRCYVLEMATDKRLWHKWIEEALVKSKFH